MKANWTKIKSGHYEWQGWTVKKLKNKYYGNLWGAFNMEEQIPEHDPIVIQTLTEAMNYVEKWNPKETQIKKRAEQ